MAVNALKLKLGTLVRESGGQIAGRPEGTAGATKVATEVHETRATYGAAGPAQNPEPADKLRTALTRSKSFLDGLASQIDTLRSAQRIREGNRTRAERALPGEEIATGVRLIRHVERAPAELAQPIWETAQKNGPLIFLDTETTGLSGGTGTLVFLCGLGRIVDGSIEVEQFLLTRPSSEAAWLAAMAERMPANATLVSFNGKAFDVPLLSARHALHRKRCIFANRTHWDLLAPTRRAFDSRWPDCKLQTAERRLLDIHRVDDLPGSFAPAAFTTLLRTGEASLVRKVVEHNRQDLVSLAHLLVALDQVYREPHRFDADIDAVARKLIDLGDRDRATDLLQHAIATQARARRTLADLHRKARRWDAASEQWDALAGKGCVHAIEALAKLEEHVRGDVRQALAQAERLVAIEPTNEKHRRRLMRLRAKLAKACSV